MSTGRIVAALFCTAALAAGGVAARAEPDPAVLEAEAARIAAMDRAKDSVLAVFSPTGQGGGSGVVISPDGYALTNFHVAKPCGNAMKCGMADGNVYDAVIVGVDPTGDVALIKLFGRDDFPAAELGDSDQVQAGDWCFAMGNPFMLATNLQPTVTFGIVSATNRYQPPAGTLLEYTDCIQTDASINPGNSGGPLFDAEGRLIGINGRGSFEKRGRVNVGVAYAISINQIKNFLGCLHAGRIVDHATLGATVRLDEDGRVVVDNILDTSDAYRRGLRYNDEIVAFGGRPITTPNGFKNVLGIFPKDWRVPLSFRRDGRRYDVLVRLQGVHREEELIQKTEGRGRGMPTPIPVPPPDREKKEGEPEGDQPAPRPDGDRPRPIQPGPQPIPIRPGQIQAPMPEICKEHFDERRGYSNYFFNKQHRERVFSAWANRANLPGAGVAWVMAGKLDGGGDYEFRVTDDEAVLKLPNTEFKWVAGDELGSSLAPPQSGGLLLSLYLWRRLAVERTATFGEVLYFGTAPLAGYDGLADVLVATHKDVQCRFYFDPADGRLLALEMFPDDHVDPCEIHFSEDRDFGSRLLPGRMEIRHGEAVFSVLKIDEYRFEATAAGDPAERDGVME
jgi:serine protease Do